MKDTLSRRERLKRKEKGPCKKVHKRSIKTLKSHNASQYTNGTYALHSPGRVNLWITPYNTLEISLPPS